MLRPTSSLRRFVASSLLALLALVSPSLAQTTYYVDSVLGASTADGLSPDRPMKTLKQLLVQRGKLTATADTVYLAGDHVGSFDFSGTKASFLQWEGHARARLRGSHEPIAEGYQWAVSASTTYKVWIGGSAIRVGNVCSRWETYLKLNGRTGGYYAVGTLSASALTADKRYYFDEGGSGDGYLYFRDDALGNPNLLTGDDRVLWTDQTYLYALDVRDINNHQTPIVISGLTIMHYFSSVGASYGIVCGGTGQRYVGLTFYDGGEVHALAITNNPNANNWAIGCIAYGVGSGTIGGADANNPFVTHNPTSGANVTGGKFINCIAHCYTITDTTGTVLDVADSAAGFYAHTSAAGGAVIADLEFIGCKSYHYGQPGIAFNIGDATSAVSNVYDIATYPVRLYRCQVIGARDQILSGNAAFQRCFFDTTAAATGAAGASGMFVVDDPAPYSGRTCLLDSCVHVTNTNDPVSTGRGVYRIMTGSQLTMLNCTSMNLANSAADDHFWMWPESDAAYVAASAGWKWNCYNSIFANVSLVATHQYFAAFDTSSPPGNFVHAGNWIYQVDANHFSFAAARDTPAEWLSVVDGAAVIGTDPLLVSASSTDPTISGTLASGSTILTNTFSSTQHTSVGFDNRAYGSRRGAIQGGALSYASSATVADLPTGNKLRRLTFAWTSDSDGSCTKQTTSSYSGQVVAAAFIPGTGASTPTGMYEARIYDESNVDTLQGTGGYRSVTRPEVVRFATPTLVVANKLTLVVYGAGEARSGTVVVYLQE